LQIRHLYRSLDALHCEAVIMTFLTARLLMEGGRMKQLVAAQEKE
jgi:hypothetical protein